MWRRLLLITALVSALFVTSLPSFADDADEAKILVMKRHETDGDGWLGISFEDVIDNYLPSRLVQFYGQTFNGGSADAAVCTSTSDPGCGKPGWMWDARSILEECTTSSQENCVESLSAKLKDGTVVNGTVSSRWNEWAKFPADSTLGIPAGGAQLTWKIPGGNPGGSEEFALIPVLKARGIAPNINYSELNVVLRPVTIVPGTYVKAASHVGLRGDGKGVFDDTTANEQGCVIAETTRCALATSFKDLSIEYTVKLRLAKSVQPWLHGRMFEPSIETKNLGGTANLLTVSAKPIVIPNFGGWVKWSDLPEAIKARNPFGAGGTTANQADWTNPDISKRILRIMQPPAGDRAIQEFKDWNPLFSDKPFAMKTLWSVRTIQNMTPQISFCSGQQFAGLVTTNAAVYSDGPPSYNAQEGSMDYVVGAPHYDTKGEVFNGTYSLIMRSDVARCIYGFGNAPISAKIEVASENGTPAVAVTTISQNADWMRLFAAGFHYSTPQIKVKLIEEKPAPVATPTPTASPSATPSPVAKKITCIKGKAKKTVTGTKCPSGYKKVA